MAATGEKPMTIDSELARSAIVATLDPRRARMRWAKPRSGPGVRAVTLAASQST
jgi:hypothetical protein